MSISEHTWGSLHRNGDPLYSPRSPVIRAHRPESSKPFAAVIEPRQLFRDCLAQSIESICNQHVIALASVSDWLKVRDDLPVTVILLSGLDHLSEDELRDRIRTLVRSERRIPALILSDDKNQGRLLQLLNNGVAAVIPTDMPVDLLVQTMRLVQAGGIFAMGSHFGQRRAGENAQDRKIPCGARLTTRQTMIVEALRRGKANKTIAYELQLQESTVKVHVRNIMKKLNAKNRTEIAYIVSNFQCQSLC